MSTYINIGLQIIIGFALVDIFSGAIHWFEDTYLDYCVDIPLISELAKDNELHHYLPRTMVAFTYLHENAKLECPDRPTLQDIEILKNILKEYKKCKRP